MSVMLYARKPNRRKHERRFSNLRMAVLTLFLTIVTSASISAFEWLQTFYLSHIRLKEISVQGNHRISSADILAASNLHMGSDSIDSTKAHIAEKRIRDRFRYLEQVEIEHRMDGRVIIAVKERKPIALVAYFGNPDSFTVIDAHGFILEEVEAKSKLAGILPYGDLPVVIGDIPKPIIDAVLRVTDFPALNIALGVLNIARVENLELFGEISRLDVRDQDDIILCLQEKIKKRLMANDQRLSGQQVIVRIASDRIKEGLSNILPVIMKRREENRETKYIDARFPGVVYCSNSISLECCEGGWKNG